MIQRNAIVTVLLAVLALASKPLLAYPKKLPIRVPEIPDLTLQDLAEVKVIPGRGPVILYNPLLCAHAGPALCQFARWHEYGHIVLGHPLRKIRPQQMEFEADRWAARHAPRESVRAAFRFFVSGGGASPTHGSANARAARLSRDRGV